MKLLGKLAILLLLGFGAIGVAGYKLLPPAARKAVEVGSHKALGTETELQGIHAGFGLGSTSLGLTGFAAEQPAGFEGPPFLKIGDIDVAVSTFSVLSDTVKVPKVTLDGLELHLIQNGTQSNFWSIYESVRKLTDGSAPAPEPEADSGSSKAVDIGVVSVSGVKAVFDLTGIPGIDQRYEYTLPAFDVDLSRQANEARIHSVEEATAKLVETLIEQTVARAKAGLSPELAALVGGDVAGLKDRVNSEIEKLRAKGENQVEEWKDQAKESLKEKAGEALGGVLEGDGGKAVEDALKNGADGLLDGVKDKVLPEGNTEDSLKKSADETLKKGSTDLKNAAKGLLGGSKDN
ncbi:MAG: hypothetical protein R3F33_08540 [Planctomycetota bacterium]